MGALTRWVLAHKKSVVAFWVVVTVAAFGSVGRAVDALSEEFNLPGGEASETNREIATIYGDGGDVAPIVPVVTLPEGTTVDSPGVAGDLDAALARVQAALPAARLASFASTGERAFVSDDGRTTFALVLVPQTLGMDVGQKEARVAQEAVDGLTVGGSPVEITGLEALRGAAAGDEGEGPSVLIEVLVAGVGALVVLAFVFASFTALLPLLMAAIAIPVTFLLTWPIASATDVSVFVEFLVALVGLGIAIDYALLVVMRWREERQRGALTNEVAVQRATEHAGSAVVFSGTTVAIALLAMTVLPVPVLRSIGIAGSLIPLVSVAVAITLLPVALATVGLTLDWPRIRREDRASRAWTAWARFVVRHRWAAAVTSAAVLIALVVAASSRQLGTPRSESLAQSGAPRAGLEKLQQSGIGPGPLAPFEALVRSPEPGAVAESFDGVAGVRGAVAPSGGDWRRDGTALVTLIPTTDGNTPDGRATLDRIRASADELPIEVTIGGQAAQSSDFVDAIYRNFPLMIALIAVLTFVLLARAFRSLVLPLQAVVLNLLSVAAAWGVMVLVWQEGIATDAIWGIEATRSINEWIPVLVFAFLFGVSMDYQVFIISRMREAYDRTGSTQSAVVEGIGRTGRLVTSAALILGLAFVALSASPGTEVKMSATALAAGILLDATIVRAALVPATVSILGRWNWWLPPLAARALKVAPSPVRHEPAAEPGGRERRSQADLAHGRR
jgi:putative drug exporter of the RND superfamily